MSSIRELHREVKPSCAEVKKEKNLLNAQLLKGEMDKDERLAIHGRLTKLQENVNLLQENVNLLQEKENLLLNQRQGVINLDFVENGIGLAQLVVGIIGLGVVVAGSGSLIMKMHQRTTTKFLSSLLKTSDETLSGIDYNFLFRGPMAFGTNYTSSTTNLYYLRHSARSVALVGDNRSGKTVFLSNYILKDMFPWWYRYIFPPRGLFLVGTQTEPTVDAWLKKQIASEKENPWSGLRDLISARRDEQRVRKFLLKVFKSRLPLILRPQPTIIIVDQAEELLRAYRANFLVSFYDLVKKGRDNRNLLLMVFVINSENAVESLELMNGGNMFDIIRAPKVSRDAVVQVYGEDFAIIFDDCNSCIGIALDFVTERKKSDEMTAKEFYEIRMAAYKESNCVEGKVTREEYDKVREHYTT